MVVIQDNTLCKVLHMNNNAGIERNDFCVAFICRVVLMQRYNYCIKQLILHRDIYIYFSKQ